MTDLLVRLFIRDYKNTTDPHVRQQYGMLGSGTGIVLNLILFATKFFAGLMTGSVVKCYRVYLQTFHQSY